MSFWQTIVLCVVPHRIACPGISARIEAAIVKYENHFCNWWKIQKYPKNKETEKKQEKNWSKNIWRHSSQTNDSRMKLWGWFSARRNESANPNVRMLSRMPKIECSTQNDNRRAWDSYRCEKRKWDFALSHFTLECRWWGVPVNRSGRRGTGNQWLWNYSFVFSKRMHSTEIPTRQESTSKWLVERNSWQLLMCHRLSSDKPVRKIQLSGYTPKNERQHWMHNDTGVTY